MNAPPLLAIAVVASLSALYLGLLWIGIRRVQRLRPVVHAFGPAEDVWRRPWSSGSLWVIDRHDKVAWTISLDGALRRALFRLGPLKLRLLAMRFGLTDGHPLSQADAAWVLHRSEEEVASIEADALRKLGPEGRDQLENLSLPPEPPDLGGYQGSGRPLPLKPGPPSLTAAAEADLREPDD